MWIRSTASGLIRRTRSFQQPSHPAATILLEPQRRGCFYNEGPKLPKDPRNIVERCTNGFKILQTECGRFVEEWKDHIHLDPPRYHYGDIVPEFKFNDKKAFDNFQIVTDKDNNQGFSHAELIPTRNGTALFKGVLDTRLPKDGITKASGLVVMQGLPKTISFQREAYYEWLPYTHFAVRCRGDGRSYTINLTVFGSFDVQQHMLYQYPLYTRGGPYWQLTLIPFSKFFLVNKGRVQDKQCRIPLTHVRKVGVALADSNPGPFELEIDFIGLSLAEKHSNDFAYELYETPESYGLGY